MKRTANLAIVLIAASLILLTVGTHRLLAQNWGPAQAPDLKQVALFKNGLGFFVAEATCPADKTTFRITLPAAPAHGTLWISHAPDIDLVGATAREVESTEAREAITIAELLEANQGRSVSVTIDDKEISGVITYFARNREPVRPNPYAPGTGAGDSASRDPWNRTQAALAMIRTETGTLCIDPRSVTKVAFAGEGVERNVASRVKKVELNVRLNRPAAGRKLTLTFLAKGVTWAPSYSVDITEAGKARLAAKALVINDTCKMNNVAIDLVTGFPHLQFSDIISPMAKKESLAQFLQALNRGRSGRGQAPIMSNVMRQSVAYSRDAGGPVLMPEYGAAEVGVVAEDLFLYPAGKVTLDRNEVAYVPLFTESIPHRHVYQWDIPDYVDEHGRYVYSRDQGGSQAAEQEIWHSLRLTNTTKVPWTTAPGQTVKGGAILGQDTLKYTPPGADVTLRITRAVGVKAEQIELEKDRKREALRLYGDIFDLITVQGHLSVLNAQGKAVTMEITKTLSGEVKSTEPDAKQEKLAKGLRRMNGLTKLTWTIELAPGAEKRLSYTYEVYVRR